jgi:hypothetical protein
MGGKSCKGWIVAVLAVCGALLVACAPAESELGDPPPGSTLIILRTSGGGGTISVSIDGVAQGGLTAIGVDPGCNPSSTGEEKTTGHLIKFVTPGVHVIVWSGTASGSASVTTYADHCTYKGV